MPDALTNLKQMPLELREGVYEEAIEPLQTINHTEKSRGTIIEYFRNLLPKPFRDDPQVTDEGTTAFIRQTLRTVQKIKVPGSECFEPVKSLVLQWDGVRQLEFTNTQTTYAKFAVDDGSSSPWIIHDIVTRCPNLEVLMFRISPTFMLKPMAPTSATDEAQGSSACTNLLRILEHPKIRRLELQCAEGRQTFTGFSAYADPEPPSTNEFRSFVETFREATKAVGRKIDLEVDFSPGIVKNPNNVEMQRRHENGFTWIEYHDFFG
jgi:hypothetical protein